MVFISATSVSLPGIKSILNKFYSASGLSVSLGKSELFCCGVPTHIHEDLAATVGLKIGTLPVRYLGVPHSFKKLSVADYKPLLDKITNRITCWSSKFLSYAGRLELIESVLSSLYSYWCTIFLRLCI